MYEPKIEVVRRSPIHDHRWVMEDGLYPDSMERAYLVRGVPVLGKRVMDRDGTVHTVRNLEVKWVEMEDGSHRLIEALRPYDPEAERLRVMTELVRTMTEGFVGNSEDIARAVLDALKEVDDG